MHALQKVTAGGCRSLGLLWGGRAGWLWEPGVGLRVGTSVWESCGDGGENGVKTGCGEAASSHLAFVSPLQLVLWLLQQHGRCNRYQGGDFPQRTYLGKSGVWGERGGRADPPSHLHFGSSSPAELPSAPFDLRRALLVENSFWSWGVGNGREQCLRPGVLPVLGDGLGTSWCWCGLWWMLVADLHTILWTRSPRSAPRGDVPPLSPALSPRQWFR